MKKLHFSIQINATPEKVWKTMLEDKTYRIWTASFMPGSHVVGSWEKGSKIQFLGPDEHGKMGGMTSQIVESKQYEFVSIQHLGIVSDGVEDTTSDEAKKWAGFENYTFKDLGSKTELIVDVDIRDDYASYFEEVWPKALHAVKELAEK